MTSLVARRYLSSRDKRRSASTLPPVWHVAQYSSEFCFTVLCAPDEHEDAYTVANARVDWESPGGRWGVAAFVNNVFEEEYRVYAFDSSLFAGVVAGVYGRPRWYGVSATYRFGQ